jgi:hypothetical protein
MIIRDNSARRWAPQEDDESYFLQGCGDAISSRWSPAWYWRWVCGRLERRKALWGSGSTIQKDRVGHIRAHARPIVAWTKSGTSGICRAWATHARVQNTRYLIVDQRDQPSASASPRAQLPALLSVR